MGPLQGAYVGVGLGRNAALCNMPKLMRCNKWANPPKACPLWQKHKAFRQAWRSLCLRQAGSLQWVSVSLWETPSSWLIVRDTCPVSSPGVQEVNLVGTRESVCGESNVRKRSPAMCAIHGGGGAYRGTSGQNQVGCAAWACTHMDGHIQWSIHFFHQHK